MYLKIQVQNLCCEHTIEYLMTQRRQLPSQILHICKNAKIVAKRDILINNCCYKKKTKQKQLANGAQNSFRRACEIVDNWRQICENVQSLQMFTAKMTWDESTPASEAHRQNKDKVRNEACEAGRTPEPVRHAGIQQKSQAGSKAMHCKCRTKTITRFSHILVINRAEYTYTVYSDCQCESSFSAWISAAF